jgi:LuxR family maltose regulon positive regulatory protein
VLRPRLIARLSQCLHRKLTLISAPAGFGKTTLVSSWAASCELKVAWVSLDEGDSDPKRFLTYFVATLQAVGANIGEEVLGFLRSPQPPPAESVLTALLNGITTVSDHFVLVLDDYHVIDANLGSEVRVPSSNPGFPQRSGREGVDGMLAFLLEHLPQQMHLIITTREDPRLPLARLRARGQLTELRAKDLRFTNSEAAGFLNQTMGLDLSAADIDALETRTEGWIAGLQLAAISMQGYQSHDRFIESFTGSSRFIIDYLAEEVLEHEPEEVRDFLLRTSILERMCAPLCDEVLNTTGVVAPAAASPLPPPPSSSRPSPHFSSQAMLERLERSNLFVVPLDNERCWYRYHHLFADLLRQRLNQQLRQSTKRDRSSTNDVVGEVAQLHVRASRWYEDNGLEVEAFHHATAANDVERAERLIEGEGVPLHFRGAGAPVRKWLASLPKTVLDARPSLWVTYASALMMTGQHTAVEEQLQAAEAAVAAITLQTAGQGAEPDDGLQARDLVGRIASMRATVAIIQHDVEALLVQSQRALEYLHPDNLPLRTAATYTLGHAYQLQGDRVAASKAYAEVIATSKSFGPSIYTTAATLCLGQVQEADCHLQLAAETYRRVLVLAGDPPRPIACEAHLGLARIFYQWNDLEASEQHGRQCLELTRQMESVGTFAQYGVFLASLKLAQGDVLGADAILTDAEQSVRQHNFMFRMPDVIAAQVLTLLHEGNLTKAAHLANTHALPFSQARICLAQGDPGTAIPVLGTLQHEAEARGWADELLKVMVLQAVALYTNNEKEKAVKLLGDTLALAETGGFIRIFVDEGPPMAHLLAEASANGIMPAYVSKLLAAFDADKPERPKSEDLSYLTLAAPMVAARSLIEPLSQRELEILQLITRGLSNREISERLFLALSTVKGHNRIIFSKLQVERRTEAVARARELGVL